MSGLLEVTDTVSRAFERKAQWRQALRADPLRI